MTITGKHLLGLLKFIASWIPLIERGLVLNLLWLWFVVPLGVPAFGSFWQALGISTIVGMLLSGMSRSIDIVQESFDFLFKKSRPDDFEQQKKERTTASWVINFILPLFYLAFGALYRYLGTGSLPF